MPLWRVSYKVGTVVGDIRERGLDTLELVAMLYLPIRQDSTNGITLCVGAAV